MQGHGGRLPVPTLAELNRACEEGREVVACSGLRYGPLTALSIACRNGDTATLSLNANAGHVLVQALIALFPEAQATGAARVKRTDTGCEVQVGHLSSQEQ